MNFWGKPLPTLILSGFSNSTIRACNCCGSVCGKTARRPLPRPHGYGPRITTATATCCWPNNTNPTPPRPEWQGLSVMREK